MRKRLHVLRDLGCVYVFFHKNAYELRSCLTLEKSLLILLPYVYYIHQTYLNQHTKHRFDQSSPRCDLMSPYEEWDRGGYTFDKERALLRIFFVKPIVMASARVRK